VLKLLQNAYPKKVKMIYIDPPYNKDNTTPIGKVYNEIWMGEEKTFKELLADNRIIFPKKGEGSPRKKYYKFEREEEGQSATNWWNYDKFGHNQEANDEMTALFNGIKNIFSNPKSTKLVKNLIRLANLIDNDIILDFFAGSGTTAHAVMALNQEDKGSRKYILVQLPETTNPKSEAYKAGYKKISDITKERIKRAMSKLEYKEGFKSFYLDNSNFQIFKEVKSSNYGFITLSEEERVFYFSFDKKIEENIAHDIPSGAKLICYEKALTINVKLNLRESLDLEVL
jgi:adenine specific DNA methylase Mod